MGYGLLDAYVKGAIMPCQVLKRQDQPDIVYETSVVDTKSPTVLFIHGYRSDMTGSKSAALHAYCAENGINFTRFDASGHGQSVGEFRNLTLSDWLQDTLDIIDQVIKGQIILVGSSMGGWLALRAAQERSDRVIGIIGVAAAPDFTEQMKAGLTPDQAAIMNRDGVIEVPSAYGPDPYVITRALIDDGQQHLLLGRQNDLAIPMILLQGGSDPVVPRETPDKINVAFPRSSILVHLVEDGDHGLSQPDDLAVLYRAVDAMLSGRLADFVI
jgi:pimeloyl-ACP methyl ester carboxylesterase